MFRSRLAVPIRFRLVYSSKGLCQAPIWSRPLSSISPSPGRPDIAVDLSCDLLLERTAQGHAEDLAFNPVYQFGELCHRKSLQGLAQNSRLTLNYDLSHRPHRVGQSCEHSIEKHRRQNDIV